MWVAQACLNRWVLPGLLTAGKLHVAFDLGGDVFRHNRVAVVGEEQGFGVGDKQLRAGFDQVFVQPCHCPFTQRHHALAIALAVPHPEQAPVEIDIV